MKVWNKRAVNIIPLPRLRLKSFVFILVLNSYLSIISRCIYWKTVFTSSNRGGIFLIWLFLWDSVPAGKLKKICSYSTIRHQYKTSRLWLYLLLLQDAHEAVIGNVHLPAPKPDWNHRLDSPEWSLDVKNDFRLPNQLILVASTSLRHSCLVWSYWLRWNHPYKYKDWGCIRRKPSD